VEQRDQMQTRMARQAPHELLDGFAAAAQRLDAVDFASSAPKVGEQAPAFTLPDQRGDQISLAELWRDGPLVLIFYRGEWCPYCNLQLRTFQAHVEEFAERGAQLVAISPQTPDHSMSMAEKNSLGFYVLSDVGAEVIDRYGLRYDIDEQTRALMEAVGNDVGEHNGPGGWTLPAAATFVIDTGGIVRYANVRGDWRERAEPSDVLAVLDELSLSAN
jgi:peroxiredoxin